MKVAIGEGGGGPGRGWGVGMWWERRLVGVEMGRVEGGGKG